MRLFLIALIVSFTGLFEVSAQQMFRPAIRQQIALDAGIQLPFGNDAKALDLSPAFGINATLWHFVSQNVGIFGSVGTSWFNLGKSVATTQGTMDLSAFNLQLTPLMGGVGYMHTESDIVPFGGLSAGVTFITLNFGSGRPISDLNNEAHFTVGGFGGVGMRATTNLTFLVIARYHHLVGEELSSLGLNAGITWAFF